MRTLLLLLLASLFSLPVAGQAGWNVYDLRCENLIQPEGINTDVPRFSWKIKSGENGVFQQSYQLLVATDKKLLNNNKADLWNSGKVNSSSCVLIPYGGKKLSSRSNAYWKVGVWNKNGKVSWSEPAAFSIGFLNKKDWMADYIGLPVETDSMANPQLRKSFDYGGEGLPVKLHVNSLGYHEVWVNGKKVSEAVLAPAMSQLGKRSLVNTYDVTSYLQKGKNELVLWLAQGWYRPWVAGFCGIPVVRAQMEKLEGGQWKTVVATDESWSGRESGYSGIGSWRPHRFGGERIDASTLLNDLTHALLENANWRPVAKVSIPDHEVSPQMSESNRITETIKPVKITRTGDSTFVIDMGKNLTGWFEMGFPPLQRGQEIKLEYADFDEAFAKNRQADLYIASGKGKEVFCNKFNYHAFRYVKISGVTTEPVLENIKSHLIQTGFRQTSSFVCSDPDMNAIHDMVQYTLRCLSLGGYLVDCPHIERLGYGGDGNASTATAQTMYDLSPLYANWLQAWADCVREDGSMPHTAPNPYSAGGGPYWCGFIITASWETYLNYGDLRSLEKYYPVMQQWLGYVEKYSPEGLLKRWPDTDYRGWYLGDWAVPEGVDQKAEASVDLVNNCFAARCYETMAKIANVLGKSGDKGKYSGKAEFLKQQVHKTFYNKEMNSYATNSQIDLIFPMLTKVTPDDLVAEVIATLYRETAEKHKGHLACGLVGIPVLTEWAISQPQTKDFMYSMLKKRDYPGYLYMIDNGATTTWEHWNGDRSHIHNCYNGIGTWFYQAVGGIRPDANYPAYEQFYIQPQVPDGITWAKTSKETPYGAIELNWSLTKTGLKMDVLVPPGSTGKLILPQYVKKYTFDGKEQVLPDKTSFVMIGSGRHEVVYQLYEPSFAVCGKVSAYPQISAAGYQYVESSVGNFLVPDKGDSEFMLNLEEMNRTGAQIISCTSFFPGKLKIVGPDPLHEEALAWADTALRRAEKANIPFIVFGSGGARKVPDGFSKEQATGQFIAFCKRLAPLASKYHVTVVIEPLNTGETNLINSLAEGAAVVQAVNHPNIQLLCDIYHMLKENEPASEIVKYGRYIRHCHIAEKEKRTSPGSKGDDFIPYFRALKEIDYNGCLSIECNWQDFDKELVPALEYMKKQFRSL